MKIMRFPIAFILLLAAAVVYAQAPSAIQIFMPDGSRPERELRFTLTRDDVRMSRRSIQEKISRFGSEECAKLIEANWAAESEERIDAVDRGELQTIDGPSALRELRDSIRK